MNNPSQKPYINSSSNGSKELLDQSKDDLIDPLAKEIANHVQWQYLDGLSTNESDLYPIAIVGKGPPVLLLHGFDSSFLEFRRLVPLLSSKRQLIIPDLYGFGFCPRKENSDYGLEPIISHLNIILNKIKSNKGIEVVGASMGGAVAMELARQNPQRINRLLLLSPAGLTGKSMPIPKPLDQLGVWFLSQDCVRKRLCKQAFADPDKSVGPAEEQIASFHLGVPGWRKSLAAFARKGGLANCGEPLPKQPINIIWGSKDRILTNTQKEEVLSLFKSKLEELNDCGHLPHLDQPELVAKRLLQYS